MIACFFRSAKKKLTPQPVDLPYHAPESLLASPLTGTVPAPVTPVSAVTPSSSHQLTPQQLHFGTPSEQSPGSSNSSQLTPQMESMKLGQGRGRPRKVLQPPSYGDFPVGAPPEEIECYLKAKKTQKWHYDILTSSKAAEHQMKENIHATKKYHETKVRSAASQEVGNDEDRAKELSHIR